MKKIFFFLMIPLLLTQCTKQESVDISKGDQEVFTISDDDLMKFHEDFAELLLHTEENLPKGYSPLNESELAEKIDSESVNQFINSHKAEINSLSKNMTLTTKSNEFKAIKQNSEFFVEETLNFQHACKYGGHKAQKCMDDCFSDDFLTFYGTFIIQAAGCIATGPAQPACSAAVLANFLWKVSRLNRKCTKKCCPPPLPKY